MLCIHIINIRIPPSRSKKRGMHRGAMDYPSSEWRNPLVYKGLNCLHFDEPILLSVDRLVPFICNDNT